MKTWQMLMPNWLKNLQVTIDCQSHRQQSSTSTYIPKATKEIMPKGPPKGLDG